MSYKGLFKPKNPAKYKGNPSNIVYRSSWELKFMSYLDSHPDVLYWGSEEFCIPYRSPIDGKYHRYFPDFYVQKVNPKGREETLVVEIKPSKETKPPTPQTKKTKRYLKEVYTWGVNTAKWEAAKQFCSQRNWRFLVLTEHELGIKI